MNIYKQPEIRNNGRSIDDGRSISRNVASLNILVHDVINLLYQENGDSQIY